MKNKRLTTILFSGITTVFLIGCGGGGGDSSSTANPTASNVPTGSYTVSVIDDNISGATISAPECATFSHNGGNSYTLKECIGAPSTITAVGGFVDVDGDGVQGATEVSQTAPLILKVSQTTLTNNFAVTPLSTLASQESNLSALASALGVNESDFFQDNAANRNKMRAINAILISAREAGITKYDLFISDLKELIKTKGSLAAAQADMMNPANLAAYKTKFGIVFGGFVNDTSNITLDSDPLAQVKAKNTVPAGKVRLGGFVWDGAIADANITIYDGATIIGSVSSDSIGRYKIDIDSTALMSSKVLKIVAIKGSIKLIAYITTDELKAGNFGSRVSSGTVEDLVISNVTTAKAVMIDKLDSNATLNALTMTQTKALVESLYADDVLKIASSIKAVIDGGASMSQSDTLALASDVASGTQTADKSYSTAISSDPILSHQLTSTTSVPTGTTSMRAVMEGKTFYQFDYFSGFTNNPFTYTTMKINTDGSLSSTDYRNDTGTNWISFQTQTSPSGTMKWSSDGNILYDAGDYWVPQKHTLLKKEVITSNGISANIYFTRDETTADGTEGFFTNFAATSNDGSGTYTPATKQISYTYSDGGTNTFYLGNNGYLQWDPVTGVAGTDTTNKWETITRYGKTFYVVQWSDYRAIFYIDANNHVYKKDYNPIGTVEISWMTDSPALLYVWKNITQTQRDTLQAQIPMQWNWQTIQRIFFDFLKSL
ncbi:MAG: hypothetical protein PHW18_02360 [Sulfuricurvum sp.]|uniref:hypothetical protein n=1 Tax=Sulfuricurvum sp. TaxID=2025608 RepID=UPI002621CFD3|nr:hypothetical protein [Sulfuricurvum sp.]MDD2828398.1 hypothetical protein [Sulfuricurvum sp.]MDD4949403.1 hypothetical protein [Sulfuricurvum sp.]